MRSTIASITGPIQAALAGQTFERPADLDEVLRKLDAIPRQGAAGRERNRHLVVLRSAPASDPFACYFFNRANADGVRMVSYQTTETGEINEPRAEFAEDLDWLWLPLASHNDTP